MPRYFKAIDAASGWPPETGTTVVVVGAAAVVVATLVVVPGSLAAGGVAGVVFAVGDGFAWAAAAAAASAASFARWAASCLEERFLAREPCARGGGGACLLCGFLSLHLHDLRLNRREQLPSPREHRADGRALAVELGQGRATGALRVLQTLRRSGQPVPRANGG